MQDVQPAQHHEQVQYTEKITEDIINRLSTEKIKQYLYGRTIKTGSIDYRMLMELKHRGENVYQMKKILNYNILKD